jgi:hypothetical protein
MKIRLAMLFIMWGATWAVAQARPAAPPPARPAGTAGQTATPTTAPPPGAATQSGQVTTPPASTIGPPTPITTQAAGPGSTQTLPAPASPGTPPANQSTNPLTSMVPCANSAATPTPQWRPPNNPATSTTTNASGTKQSALDRSHRIRIRRISRRPLKHPTIKEARRERLLRHPCRPPPSPASRSLSLYRAVLVRLPRCERRHSQFVRGSFRLGPRFFCAIRAAELPASFPAGSTSRESAQR